MKMKKMIRAAVLLILCLALSGCRTRTNLHRTTEPDAPAEEAQDSAGAFSGSEPTDDNTDTGNDTGQQKDSGESGGQTKENPEASRKEYDETKPAELIPGAEQKIYACGEGDGFSGSGEPGIQSFAKLNEEAEKTATQKISAEEAEQKGISEEAEEADSGMTYYSVLLQERTEALFECKRLNVYWETKEDHLTVFRSSAEHSLILNAGAYDVSARLLEDNLHVDDGWITRKNPDVVVKVVDRSVLGTGVYSTGSARSIYADLMAREGWNTLNAVRNKRVILLSEEFLESSHLRLAAMLIIAGTAYPDQFQDLDADHALSMLGEEATGTVPDGLYYFTGAN